MSLSLRHESCPPWSWLIFDVGQKMKRHVWCRTRDGLLLGRVERAPDKVVPKWQRLFGLHRQGRIIAFEAVDASTALAAFDRFLASPEEFAAESADGARIDFHASKRSEEVSLDIWFSESDLSEAVVTKRIAREVLLKVFSDTTEAQLADFIRHHSTAHS